MAKKNQYTAVSITPFVIAFVIAAVGIVYLVGVVGRGAGPTTSKASRNTTLTVGDDALSLQQDLQNLEKNTAEDDESLFDVMK